MQDSGYSSDSPLAISVPAATTGQQVAVFAMRSTDRSAVKLTCQLNGPPSVQPLPALSGFAVGAPYNCSTMQVFSITAAGSYEFSVFGTDAVGNWEHDPVVHVFTVAYQLGSMYTRIRGPGWGASRKQSQVFMLEAVQGTPDGSGATPAAPVAFQYSVGTLSQTDANGTGWLDAAWAAVNGSQFTYTVRSHMQCVFWSCSPSVRSMHGHALLEAESLFRRHRMAKSGCVFAQQQQQPPTSCRCGASA